MISKDIFKSIAPALELVEREIQSQTDLIVETWNGNGKQAEYIEQAVHHLFRNPGKMLRPALVLLSSGLVDPTGTGGRKGVDSQATGGNLTKLATAVELIHSASLVHDDIIDEEQCRRQQLSLNKRYGNHTAVLVGDILYARSFSLLTGLRLASPEDHLEIFRLFCETTQRMCLGEIREQQALDLGLKLNLEEYLLILENKTAALMAACCRSAAIVSDAGPNAAQKLGDFGLNFGLAFQLLDDHRDHDALITEGVDIVEKACEYMAASRLLLMGLNDSPSRRELLMACDFVLKATA